MTKAAKPVAARPAPAAPAEDGRLKLQAFAGTRPGAAAPRANWELRALGAVAFELVSARG